MAESVACFLGKTDCFPAVRETNCYPYNENGWRRDKIMCSGRLAGAEIARTEWYAEGKVPRIPCGLILIMVLLKQIRPMVKSV